MPEFHCHCECSKCPPPAPSSNTSLQSLNLISLTVFHRPCQIPRGKAAPTDTVCCTRLLYMVGFQPHSNEESRYLNRLLEGGAPMMQTQILPQLCRMDSLHESILYHLVLSVSLARWSFFGTNSRFLETDNRSLRKGGRSLELNSQFLEPNYRHHDRSLKQASWSLGPDGRLLEQNSWSLRLVVGFGD